MISYSGLKSYGKSTLPSVEGWGTNMNIIRDPVKSITTRRRDKVGDNNQITNMIDESGDRMCEAIRLYAAGSNPFATVTMNNYNTRGGYNSGTAAYLPHRIMNDGAFRPPLVTLEQQVPLSRMPRGWTSVKTSSTKIDHSKSRVLGTDLHNRINPNTLSVSCDTNKNGQLKNNNIQPSNIDMLTRNVNRISYKGNLRKAYPVDPYQHTYSINKTGIHESIKGSIETVKTGYLKPVEILADIKLDKNIPISSFTPALTQRKKAFEDGAFSRLLNKKISNNTPNASFCPRPYQQKAAFQEGAFNKTRTLRPSLAVGGLSCDRSASSVM